MGSALLLAGAWMAQQVLLLLFAGLLVALIFTSTVNLLGRFVPWSRKVLLPIVLLLFLGAAVGGGALLFPRVSEQFAGMAETLPKQLQQVSDKIQASPLFKSLGGIAPQPERLLPNPKNVGASLSRLLVSVFDGVSAIVLVIFIGVFLAANPEMYRRGVVKLVPRRARGRANEVIGRCLCTLKYWLLGQGMAMIAVGIITGVSLGLAGVPMAAALGVLAGILEFVPFIGPIAAAVPAVLVAGDKALIVIGIFVAVQFVEGNLLQPLVQQKAVDLPPVITLAAIVVFGTLFGLLGMLIATPLAAVIVVLVQELYVKDGLKDDLATE